MANKDYIFRAAIREFGFENQIDMCTEECAELIQAINKQRRQGGFSYPTKNDTLKYSKTYFDLCSEIADVKIMLEQMEMIFSQEAIQLSYDRKIQRLNQRLIDNGKM